MATLNRKKVNKLMEELGYEGAEGWSETKLVKKLNALPDQLEDEDTDAAKAVEDLDDNLKELLDEITEAVSDEEEFEFSSKAAKEEKSSGKKGKEKDKKKGKSKAESNGKEKKESAGTDKFGSRLGSKHAEANKALSKKFKSMKQLMEDAGIEGRTMYNHFNKLAEEGKILKSEDGFALKKA